ncbi:proline dehydrogenase family protein, partial [Francisella tularensis]|uniref:proline dehydrogenase family protein n=1 Tax=Francisella tularensis TaxID=263 RepID=UPI001C0EB35C
QGLAGYPVFTRKYHTDVSYQACVKQLFENHQYIYPQFATHNALSNYLLYIHAMRLQSTKEFIQNYIQNCLSLRN